MATFYMVPGVYPKEIIQAETVQPITTTIGAAVFASRKGTLKPRLTTTLDDFNAHYGTPDPTWSFGHYSSRAFLVNSTNLYVRRVVREAKHAGLVITNDKTGAEGSSTFITKFPAGRNDNATTDVLNYTHLVFSAALVATNQVEVTITNPDTEDEETVTVTYATSNDATLAALATAITTKINETWATTHIENNLAVSSATVVQVGSSTTNDRIIRIFAPENVPLTYDVVVSLGASQATVSVEYDPYLFAVYAENPGKWANDIGIQITNANIGVRQRSKLTFSSAVVANQAFQTVIEYNGSTLQIGPVNFDTDQATTMESISDAIIEALGSHSDTIIGTNNLEITVVSPVDGPNTFSFVAPEVINISGSATRATVTASAVLTGVDSEDTFEVWIYERSNQRVPLEKHTVSFNTQIDGFGQQQFIDEVINLGALRSDSIRIYYNTANPSGVLGTLPEGTVSGTTHIYWLTGGDDGIIPTSDDIVLAWDDFADRSQRAVRLLINCGYSTVDVHQKMVAIAEARYDCIAILDVPSAYQDAEGAVEFRRNLQNINTTYAALYSCDIQIRDPYTNRTLYVPISGYVASVYAYSDNKAAEWFSPAGFDRALMNNVLKLRHEYTEGEQALLATNQVNYIRKFPGKGYVVWLAETLSSRNTPLRNVSVRRTLISIEVALTDSLNYQVHEPNDPYTWNLIQRKCTDFLQPIKDGRGLNQFQVFCDDQTNKPIYRDQGVAKVIMVLEFTLPIRAIELTSVITKQGASISEALASITSTT